MVPARPFAFFSSKVGHGSESSTVDVSTAAIAAVAIGPVGIAGGAVLAASPFWRLGRPLAGSDGAGDHGGIDRASRDRL